MRKEGIIGIGDNVLDAYMEKKCYYPGGNAVNVPVLALQCGAKAAAYVGIMGDDVPGQRFMEVLQGEGVDVSRVRSVHRPTACNHISIDETGDRHFVGNNGKDVAELMLNLVLTPSDYALIEQYALAHTSVHSFIRYLHPGIARRAPLSLDFSDGYTPINIEQIAPLLTYAFLSGKGQDEETCKALARYTVQCGARHAIVTMGEKGSFLCGEEGEWRQEATRTEVKDALGAGDAFIAAFLQARIIGAGIKQAAQQGSDFAAKACGWHGAFGHPIPFE